MAIAPGVPVPQIYILDDEKGINAFAAVTSPVAGLAVDADAVIKQTGIVRAQNINHGRRLLSAIPQEIKTELSDILGAMSVTCLLLLEEDPQVRNIQIKRLQKSAPGKLVEHLLNLEPHLKALDLQLRLPVLDLALPVLRQMSAGQYAKFKVFIQMMVEADARLSFFEFALQQIIRHRLGANISAAKKKWYIKTSRRWL